MEMSYEALRARMAKDYQARIIEDGWGRYRLAQDASERYGFEVSTKQARRVIARVKERVEAAAPSANGSANSHEVDYEAGVAEVEFDRPTTVDEAIRHLQINEADWKIARVKPSTYEGQAKVDVVLRDGEGNVRVDREGEPLVTQEQVTKTMYGFRFTLEPRHPAEHSDFAQELLRQVADASPVYRARARGALTGNLLRVHIPDIHVGKDGFQSDWSLEVIKERVLTVVDEFAALASQHGVDRISLPLGHDFVHIDKEHIARSGTLHTTSSGTPVERSLPWITLFLFGCDLASLIVRRLLETAPVDVLVVPGNHSEQTEIAIARVLMAEFSGSPDVAVDLDERREKYYEWGVNGFMDHHGDTVGFNDLPLNFANLNPELWGRTRWHEVTVGHKHITKARPVGYYDNGRGGCMVRISPSLSPQDAWHNKYGYHGMPGAEAFLYNRERPGPFAQYQRFF